MINYHKNITTLLSLIDYSKYEVIQLSRQDEIDFQQHGNTPSIIIIVVRRIFCRQMVIYIFHHYTAGRIWTQVLHL